ncbi:MAG TPA: MmgE/PrpD family protein, partial [Solirubrobacteraceae bacterium]|nr:MmgE/PrpD family protein [Solirubrobacteraceae bacterium]
DQDRAVAGRALLDTVAVILAGRRALPEPLLERLSLTGRWAALAHVLDFDDLHLDSTAHISAVCVPAALAEDGGAHAYLAGAGVMARLGAALGWGHYASGWHATCTAGAPGAAVAAAVARGLDARGVSTALALAVPAAGGVQRAFGTSGKSLQVAFAAEAGVRAAALAGAGADADPSALDVWLELVGGRSAQLPRAPEVIPGGLAVKVYPCCYALQRPIAAVRKLEGLKATQVRRISVTTPSSALTPLIHHRPTTGLEGKFSLPYGLACALLDDPVSLDSFSDTAVARPEARRLMNLVEVEPTDEGRGLLAGSCTVSVTLEDGSTRSASVRDPPAGEAELDQKIDMCAGALADEVRALRWETAREFLRANGTPPL